MVVPDIVSIQRNFVSNTYMYTVKHIHADLGRKPNSLMFIYPHKLWRERVTMFIGDRHSDIAKTCLEPLSTIFTDTFSRFQKVSLIYSFDRVFAFDFCILFSIGISESIWIRSFALRISPFWNILRIFDVNNNGATNVNETSLNLKYSWTKFL